MAAGPSYVSWPFKCFKTSSKGFLHFAQARLVLDPCSIVGPILPKLAESKASKGIGRHGNLSLLIEDETGDVFQTIQKAPKVLKNSEDWIDLDRLEPPQCTSPVLDRHPS